MNDGVEAIEILENTVEKFIVITDINMPKMGGYSLTMRICERKIAVQGIVLVEKKAILLGMLLPLF